MNKEIKYSISKLVNAPKSIVWSVILSPDTYKEIWAAEFSGSWEKGRAFSFSGEWDGSPYQDKCSVIDRRDEKLLVYTYWSSFWNVPQHDAESCIIKYEINELDEHSSELTITQTGFRDDTHYAETVTHWEDTIDFMKRVADKLYLESDS